MRLILFAAGILAFIGWACFKIFGGSDASLINSVSSSASETAVDTIESVSPSITASETDIVLPPIISIPYVFKYRPLPSGDYFQSFTTGSEEGRSQLKIIRDSVSRSVVVMGHADEASRAVEALKAADVPAESCHAQAWVVFVRKDKNDSFDFSLSFDGGGVDSTALLTGKTFSGALSLKKVTARLEYMRSKGLVEVVQAPHLEISSGKVSLIETGEEIAVPIVTVNQNVTQTSVEYRKVGLSLEMTPFFMADGKLRLEVKQKNGLVGQLRDVGGVEVPELTNQSLTTTIETKVGSVVVLGGVESSTFQRVRGLLSSRDELQTGYLYVVLATYSKVPRAVPVLESVPAPSSLLPPLK